MGLLGDLWDWVKGLWDLGDDPDDSYGAPRGGWDYYLNNFASNRGLGSVEELKANKPLYDWAREGAKYTILSDRVKTISLAYNKWLQDEPGLANPRKIVYRRIIGSTQWKYADEDSTAWRRDFTVFR